MIAKEELEELEELEDLYLIKRLTSRQIAKIYGLNKSSVLRNLHKYGIPTTHERRKFEIKKKISLIREQKEIVYGTMLGDGHIANHGKLARLMIEHCEEQKDLTEWLHQKLNPLSLDIREEIDKRTGYKYFGFNTVTHFEFKALRKVFYSNNVKIIPIELEFWLTPLALAVWIMDDGHLNGGIGLRIQTDSFTEQENIELQRLIQLKFEANCKIAKYTRRNKVYCYLSFNKRNTQIVSDIVRPYIISCMNYKILPPASTTTRETSFTEGDIV